MAMRCTFVQVGNGLDGIGKLVMLDSRMAEVEYFESPAGPRTRSISVPISDIREVELSPQTRIFWFNRRVDAWFAGRVDGGLVSAKALNAHEDHYHVRFPNGQQDRVPISELFVRCSHPIDDPSEYLAERITDTPFFFDGRCQIVRHIAVQRTAFGGMTAVASSAVELLEHQVAIVRRVLADPVERYLLADEVGLGKTIEAGILVRQHIIDFGTKARVLVIAPDHLVSQWQGELATKFFLSESESLKVIPVSSVAHLDCSGLPFSMLVIDEAHRSALNAFSNDTAKRSTYAKLRALAASTPRLLLLSGTPVLHQEDGFLGMLHLLDPNAYPLDDRESFRRRVRARQEVAEATADLADDASSFFVQDAINRLEHAFGTDQRLLQLCAAVRQRLNEDVNSTNRTASLRALRNHITDTYRLHRRLLRTRRSDPRVRGFLPQRTGLLTIDHEDQSRNESFDFLETWRLSLSGEALASSEIREIFADFVAAAMSHPQLLLRLIDERLSFLCAGSVPAAVGPQLGLFSDVESLTSEAFEAVAPSREVGISTIQSRGDRPPQVTFDGGSVPHVHCRTAFDGEIELLQERRTLIEESCVQDVRASRIADWLLATPTVQKAIVFASHRDIAASVTETLRSLLPQFEVLRYDGNAEQLQVFEKNGTKALLICDANVEEGLNLQRCGATLVHYDLPLEPSRIEQRIGRVDRIEARGHLRNVAFGCDAPYEKEWVSFLARVVRIFDRSAAPLQYALAESTARIRSRFLTEGPDSIEQEAALLSDPHTGLDCELRRIQAQELLDSIEIDRDHEAEFFEKLSEQDEEISTSGEAALDSWLISRLQFERHELSPQIVQYTHNVQRPTLMPLLEAAARFGHSIDREAFRTTRHRLPMKPMTFDRALAETKHVELLRVGHPFMTSLEHYLRSDDRGVAFAMWRHLPGLASTRLVNSPSIFLRFDFMVEADLSYALQAGVSGVTSEQALRRRADSMFPPDYRTIWLTSDLELVTNSHLLAILSLPYSRHVRKDGSRDINLRPDRWEQASALISFGDWFDLCARARRLAEEMLRNDPILQRLCLSCVEHMSGVATRAQDVFLSRIATLSGAVKEAETKCAQFESLINTGLLRGIKAPSIRLDSTGVVVLSATTLETDATS